ncbi:MAG: 4-alpha-glucanotransferase [Ruminococcaceae bacterium]|nr:4-alpha-glucanotransferase [Oscillospiraceae bacterium]
MKKTFTRGAGVLMPISALPSPYGIGTLGNAAYAFADFLVAAGQRYWQVLPVGPTGYGDSPYQSFSAFAGNPYFIDPDRLVQDGLLTTEEANAARETVGDVDYDRLFRTRFDLLRTAYRRFMPTDEYHAFCRDEAHWLTDYALYTAVKEHFGYRDWSEWDEDIRLREPSAVARHTADLSDDIGFTCFCQYLFRCQWNALKAYVNERGISLIGDIPLYVSADSADVWANRHLFQLDTNGYPTAVAGVPPDMFSATGQRWGNPLYDWDRMTEDGFDWWRKRVAACRALYDALRIDHFIGMARYYAIPASSETAIGGEWRQGPARLLTDAIDEAAGDMRILAEDLGVLHPKVRTLLRQTGYPGMSVLLFGFDGNPENPHLPHNFPKNRAVYGGTHDNDTIVGYCTRAGRREITYMMRYLGVKRRAAIPVGMLRAAYQSVADLAIFQMQDLLALDSRARMNTPSTVGENWKWRMAPDALTDELAVRLKEFVTLYNR